MTVVGVGVVVVVVVVVCASSNCWLKVEAEK